MSASKITKGMILAAGLGTRLLPITQQVPKPLVPVLNVPNILHNLFLLKRAGVTQIILNLHHLPLAIETYLGDGKKWGLSLSYSRESLLLGTGGGLKKAEKFFGGESLVLANCDFISDVDLAPIIQGHLQRDAMGTMVLYQNAELQPLYSKVGVDPKGHLCALPRFQVGTPADHGIFTGVHVLNNGIFNYLQEKPSGINEVLYPALMKESPHRIFGDFMKGYWHDTGDLPALFLASMKLLDQLQSGQGPLVEFMESFGGYEQKRPGVWMPKSAKLPVGVKISSPVVIGDDCKFGSGCELGPYTVLGEGAVVGDNVGMSRFVALGRPQIASGETIEGAIQFCSNTLTLKPPTRD